MSVMMTLRYTGDADKLEAFAKDKHALLMSISDKAKQHGVLSHRFYASDNELMVVDEWPSEEAFQAFFDASPEISSVMQDSGATSRPTITFWRKLDTGDDV
jgi:heme-degrading monooxygenase HmoA